jgi:hypothetical protein
MPRFLLALTVTLTALTFALALTVRAWGGAHNLFDTGVE